MAEWIRRMKKLAQRVTRQQQSVVKKTNSLTGFHLNEVRANADPEAVAGLIEFLDYVRDKHHG